jgi:hypothetical protein
MPERLGSLVPTTVVVMALLAFCAPPWTGGQEIVLFALALLLLAWPALAFYAWARRRGDL